MSADRDDVIVSVSPGKPASLSQQNVHISAAQDRITDVCQTGDIYSVVKIYALKTCKKKDEHLLSVCTLLLLFSSVVKQATVKITTPPKIQKMLFIQQCEIPQLSPRE